MPPAPSPALRNLQRTPDPGIEQYEFTTLNRNERTLPLPEWFVARIREAISDELLRGYPTTDELYEELSASLEVEPERLLLTAGSDGAVKAIHHAFVQSGDAVVALDPSYAMYRVYAQMFQARAVVVPFERDLELDGDRLLESIRPGTRLVMLANPNQPTGTMIAQSLMRAVLERTAQVQALVAVDEAYYPFSKSTMLPMIHEFPHLVVTRTFSKAAGLAGLRIGFAAGHRDVISSMFKVRSAHDVNAVAVRCAREILRCPEVVSDCVQQVDEGKRVLAEKAVELGVEPLQSHTNFMLIRVASRVQPQRLVETLRELGYLVRGPFSAVCVSDCIRVTCGSPALMMSFATALEQALEMATGDR